MMNRNSVLMVLLIALWMPAGLLIMSLAGCQAGTTGLLRPIDSTVEHTITNTVTVASQVAGQAVPFPYGQAVEGLGAAVLALLAMWQGLTHSRVNQLQATKAELEKEKNK